MRSVIDQVFWIRNKTIDIPPEIDKHYGHNLFWGTTLPDQISLVIHQMVREHVLSNWHGGGKASLKLREKMFEDRKGLADRPTFTTWIVRL